MLERIVLILMVCLVAKYAPANSQPDPALSRWNSGLSYSLIVMSEIGRVDSDVYLEFYVETYNTIEIAFPRDSIVFVAYVETELESISISISINSISNYNTYVNDTILSVGQTYTDRIWKIHLLDTLTSGAITHLSLYYSILGGDQWYNSTTASNIFEENSSIFYVTGNCTDTSYIATNATTIGSLNTGYTACPKTPVVTDSPTAAPTPAIIQVSNNDFSTSTIVLIVLCSAALVLSIILLILYLRRVNNFHYKPLNQE